MVNSGLVACWFCRALGSLHDTSLHHRPNSEAEGEIYLVGLPGSLCMTGLVKQCIVVSQSSVTTLSSSSETYRLAHHKTPLQGQSSIEHRTGCEKGKVQRLEQGFRAAV